jgi:hypothetical protein
MGRVTQLSVSHCVSEFKEMLNDWLASSDASRLMEVLVEV